MRLRLHNGLTGRVEDLAPAAPPACGVSWRGPDAGPEAFRWECLRSLLEGTLAYFGYVAADGAAADVQCGGPPPTSGIWLRPGAVASPGLPSLEALRAEGFDPRDLRLLCLKTHYRRPMGFSWRELAAAREERAALSSVAERLGAVRGALAPNATGLAGYKKRLRDCLADDLDGPEAVATLWDALRPGALSPGSQLGALKDADLALGLLRPERGKI